MNSWSPARLPKVRDQIAADLADPGSRIRVVLDQHKHLPTTPQQMSASLFAADLFWVTSAMAALAVSSAETLDQVRWSPAEWPAPRGLLVWEGGIGTARIDWVDAPITAASWAPGGEGHIMVWLWVARQWLTDESRRREMPGAENLHEFIPPLVPVAHEALSTGADWMDTEELHPGIRTVMGSLMASWLLMGQPTITDRRPERPSKAVRHAYAKRNRPEPAVSIVDLRRAYAPDDREETGHDGGRRYRHRWVVTGHWRDQKVGPGRAEVRKTWVSAHVKGPDGAPMLETTRVNVWRR